MIAWLTARCRVAWTWVNTRVPIDEVIDAFDARQW